MESHAGTQARRWMTSGVSGYLQNLKHVMGTPTLTNMLAELSARHVWSSQTS